MTTKLPTIPAPVATPRPGLSQEYLEQAHPAIIWPHGMEPANTDVFVHNEVWIDAPAEIIWDNLLDAQSWPLWYSNAADIRLPLGSERLAKGLTFDWKTFGFPVTSTVDVLEANHQLGWNVANPRFRVHHAWLLVPESSGTRVITEESQSGEDAIAFRLDQPRAMYDGHDWWLSGLKARSERMANR